MLTPLCKLAIAVFPHLHEGIQWRIGPSLRSAIRSNPSRWSKRVVKTKPGFLLYANPSDWIGSHIMVYREFEPEVSAALASCVRPGQTVLDVGANIGYFSLLLATLVGPTGKVLAVEASPAILNELRANIALNKLEDRIQVFPIAAWDSSETLTLHQGPSDNSGLTSLRDLEQSSSDFRIPARPLDGLSGDAIDCIKFDIEGAELHALRGMPQILAARPPIVLELTDTHLQQLGGSAVELLELLLVKLKYSVCEITAKGLVPRTLEEALKRSQEDQLSLFFSAGGQ